MAIRDFQPDHGWARRNDVLFQEEAKYMMIEENRYLNNITQWKKRNVQ